MWRARLRAEIEIFRIRLSDSNVICICWMCRTLCASAMLMLVPSLASLCRIACSWMMSSRRLSSSALCFSINWFRSMSACFAASCKLYKLQSMQGRSTHLTIFEYSYLGHFDRHFDLGSFHWWLCFRMNIQPAHCLKFCLFNENFVSLLIQLVQLVSVFDQLLISEVLPIWKQHSTYCPE